MASSLDRDRVLDLEGVHNFRDCGGYALAGGGRLKRGMLWRSGQHHGATDADLERIAALRLANVFDLRTDHERSTHPCRRPQGFSGTVHFIGDAERMHIPHDAAARSSRGRDAASARDMMRNAYRSFPFRPQLVEMMKRYLAVLAESESPSLVNCMAGKDRTGIAVAVLHLAAGVHPDDAVADYVLTNTAGNPAARIAAGASTISSLSGKMDEGVLRVVMGVEPDYLENAFNAMREKHGSTDGYLREVIGAGDVLRGNLRERLVEG